MDTNISGKENKDYWEVETWTAWYIPLQSVSSSVKLKRREQKMLVERVAEQIKEYFICWKRVFPECNTSTAAAVHTPPLFLRHLSSALLRKTIFASDTSAAQLSDPGSSPIASHILTNYHLLRKEVSWNLFRNKFNYIFSTLFCFLLSIFYVKPSCLWMCWFT